MRPKVHPASGMASLSSLPDPKSSATEHPNGDVLSLDYMKDFKPGPLDNYRKRASFDWKMMRVFLDGEDILRFKVSFLCEFSKSNTDYRVRVGETHSLRP